LQGIVVKGYFMKCEYLERLRRAEGLSGAAEAASLRMREEGMVVEVTEKTSIGIALVRMRMWK
jgi:hypothetical protein